MKFLLRLTETWLEDGSEGESENIEERHCIHVRNRLFDTPEGLANSVRDTILDITSQNVIHDAHHISRSVFNAEVNMVADDMPEEIEIPVVDEVTVEGDISDVKNAAILPIGRVAKAVFNNGAQEW